MPSKFDAVKRAIRPTTDAGDAKTIQVPHAYVHFEASSVRGRATHCHGIMFWQKTSANVDLKITVHLLFAP